MKYVSRIFVLSMVIVIGIGFAMPVNAAAKKRPVYVLTKGVMHMYADPDDEDDIDMDLKVTIKYKKDGTLSKAKISDMDGLYSMAYKYSGKKGLVKKQTNKLYALGIKMQSGTVKYKYTKKGYLKSATTYSGKKKKEKALYSWDAHGNNTVVKRYNKKGKLTGATYYIYNADGECTMYKEYKNGALSETTTVTDTSASTDVLKKYNADGSLKEISYRTISHGNPVAVTSYDANGRKTSDIQYYYKKIKNEVCEQN